MPYRFHPHAMRLALAAVCLTILTTPARADDQARRAILELRQQMRDMSEQNIQARIQLSERIDALHGEVASLRGQVEQLQWQLQQATRGNAPRANAARIDPIEQASYDAAAERFRVGSYGDAATAFASFVAAYPASTLASQAQFYQGSSLYATRKYKEATAVLQAMVQAHPQDTRAADALLIVAVCQVELNAVKDARTTLQTIAKHYPQSQAAQTAQERLKLLR